MAELSVIVCVYNTDENLFENCLSSIFHSSLESLEVIVIDDGSTISYNDVMKKFSRAKYYKTENQGTLKSRLFGVSKATSPYTCFVDSDDEVSVLYFEASLSVIKRANADICFNDWAFWTEKTRYVCSKDSTICEDFNIHGAAVLKKYFCKYGTEHSYYVLWNKVFKTEILLAAKSKIEELNFDKLVFAEDVLITFYAFLIATKITNTHVGYYFYRIHSGQEISVASIEKLMSHVESMSKVFYSMEAELKRVGRFSECSKEFFEWKGLMAWNNRSYAISLKNKNYDEIIKQTYGVKKIKNYSSASNKIYGKHYLLPLNFSDIDKAAKNIYNLKPGMRIYAKKYSLQELKKIKTFLGGRFEIVKNYSKANIVMPAEEYSFKLKIIHNHFVYGVGEILFPKGSRIRNILKAKL